MKTISKLLCVALCACSGLAIGQDKPSDKMMMSKNTMMAKKKIMAPETMSMAKKSMMSKESMVPGMVAKEMVQQDVMHDKEAMSMVEKATMTKTADDKMMMSDEQVSMAGEKMTNDPNAMQMLFQELVARHIAAKKMAMMKKSDPKMMTMGGKEMKSMVMDEGAMMGAKKEMMTSDSTARMMAREELIQSLMADKEVMAVVEKEAMMHEDPKMAPMMTDDKMKMEGESMMNDKAKAKGMMQETMVRKMTDGKSKMMKNDTKSKK